MGSKILERLNRAVEEAQPQKNRSPALIPLRSEYEELKKNLRLLVVAAKHYYDATEKMTLTRNSLVEHIASMSKNTPIFEHVGKDLERGETLEDLDKIRFSENGGQAIVQVSDSEIDSLLVVQRVSSVQSAVNSREYYDHVIAYAEEWENCVTQRIEKELKSIKKLQNDRSHYEKKVQALRQRASDLQAKGKSISDHNEKLIRNEAKLKEAHEIHEFEADRLCTLIEKATYEGWRDLYIFVKNLMKWESNRVGRESDIYSHLAHILESMKHKMHSKRNGK